MIRKVWISILGIFSLLIVHVGPLYAESIIVNTNILNVRLEPKGKKLGRVYRGQQFALLEEKQGWGKIKFRHNQMGWVSLDYTKPLESQASLQTIDAFCKSLNAEFAKLRWNGIQCNPKDWQADLHSVLGKPLIYKVLGENEPTSVLLCSVHSDEGTAYQCFRLIEKLKRQPTILKHRLVIAPLVNPDGFLGDTKTRTNANGVDLNRNLPSSDWRLKALKAWKSRYKSAKRRYPGPSANSEPENQFVVNLIQTFQPDKVISIHAPLNFLDLDYLDSARKKKGSDLTMWKRAENLALQFSKDSGFKFRDYRTFPGSLGRYGNEWKVPIYTLELGTSDHHQANRLFDRVNDSLVYAFNVIIDVQETANMESTDSESNVN